VVEYLPNKHEGLNSKPSTALPPKKEYTLSIPHVQDILSILSGFFATLALLPGIREFQANDIEDFLPLATVVVFHKITKLHLAVSLTGHINYINLFVRT
jgi:hypothetical protein